MGAVLRLFQRFGSVGSIARWAWKSYLLLKAKHPGESEEDIAQALWAIRYGVSPPSPGSTETIRFDAVAPERISDLEQLCLMVVFVEMDVSPNDGALYDDVTSVIGGELRRLGYRALGRMTGG